MSSVVLNPVRAGIADTPEESNSTSSLERIRAWQSKRSSSKKQNICETRFRPFVESSNAQADFGIEFNLKEYLELLGWTGRAIHDFVVECAQPVVRPLQGGDYVEQFF
jgi:hypothetical protein